MNDYFPDNFVDYDDPPLDSTSLNSDNRDFSLTSPNSDSTGLYPLSSHSPQVLTNFLNNDQFNFDLMGQYNQQQELLEVPAETPVPEKSKKASRSKKAKTAATPALTDLSNDNSSSEGKILDKSKRIQKREIAKERTKQKIDIATMFQGVDSKFLPEGYDDPNLDERTKKKMIQMVRNRISAQNSRDRKKGYMNQLEDQNAQLEAQIANLTAERDALALELQGAREEIQMLRNGGAGGCQNCQTIVKDEDFLITNNGENEEHDNVPAGGFSGLSSPRLVRFASSKGSLFGMFAFTALVCIVAFANVGQQDMVAMQGNGLSQFGQHARMLDVKLENDIPADTNIVNTKIEPITLEKLDYNKPLAIRNIHNLMDQFQQSYEPTFKAHLQKNNLVLQDDKTIQVEKEVKNAIVEYGANKYPKLRKTLPPVTSTPPALNSMVNGDTVTSTLFCHSGQEFYDTGNQNVHISNKSNLVKNNTLDLEKAEYLQLLVPKGTIMRANVNNKLTDIYGQAIYTDDQSDDTMLEIWCKVFLVREIGTTL